MKKLMSVFLAASLLLCTLAVLAEQGNPGDDMSRFTIPQIHVPTVPPIEVPEIDEIKVPKVPTASPTKKPKIVVPEIGEVDMPEQDVPSATAEASNQVEVAMEALGVSAYRALYDALSRGETVGDGSRGEAAKGLQQMLVAFGQTIRVDGIVGPKTLAALNAVRDQYELPRSDKLDVEGFSVLLQLLLEKGSEAP